MDQCKGDNFSSSEQNEREATTTVVQKSKRSSAAVDAKGTETAVTPWLANSAQQVDSSASYQLIKSPQQQQQQESTAKIAVLSKKDDTDDSMVENNTPSFAGPDNNPAFSCDVCTGTMMAFENFDESDQNLSSSINRDRGKAGRQQHHHHRHPSLDLVLETVISPIQKSLQRWKLPHHHANHDEDGAPLMVRDTSGVARKEALLPAYDSVHDTTTQGGPRVRRRPHNAAAVALWKRVGDHVQTGEFLVTHDTAVSMAAGDDPEERRSKRARAQQDIRSHMEFSLTQCLLAIAAYMAVAVIAFSFLLENWSVIDSIYFSVVTFTTVGFGDLVPGTYGAKLFTCIFAVSGVACLGIAIGVVGNNIIEAEEAALETAKQVSQQRVMALFSKTTETTPTTVAELASTAAVDPLNTSKVAGVAAGPEQPVHTKANTAIEFHEPDGIIRHTKPANAATTISSQSSASNFLSRLVWEFGMVLCVLTVFGIAVAHDPNIGFMDVPYFLVITSTTCGFGDIAPVSPIGRLATALFIPIAVGAMGHWLTMVASFIIDQRQSRYRRNLVERHELTAEDLEVMDEDGDGRVDRAEFLEFMLVAMNKVDKDLIEELRLHFSSLDSDGTGVLSKGDLIANARRKLHDPVHKLELAQYKAQLLEKGRRAGAGRESKSFWGSSVFHLFTFKDVRENV